VATVTTSLVIKRAARLRVRAVDTSRKVQLLLLAGSRIGAVVSRRDTYAIRAHVARPGRLNLRLRLVRSELVHGRKVSVLIEALGPRRAVALRRISVLAR
jgi:hypothetical protein